MMMPTPKAPEGEAHNTRIRRLRMRSWRRGIKEMDIILGTYSDTHLTELSPELLDLYDSLLSENDQELYAWVTGQETAPESYAPLMDLITAHAHDM